MKKVLIIGCPGAGKSTFARRLAKITGMPLIHLDILNWNADKTTVDKAVFLERLESVVAQETWIIDGNYGFSLEMRLESCDTVIFLDYSLEVCLAGLEDRLGKVRPDMPWVEEELDEEFLTFVRDFGEQERLHISEMLERYSQKQISIFRDREQAQAFLEAVKKELS